MTTKTLSGTLITNGYTLSGAYSLVSITSTGTIIGGTGAAGAAGPVGGVGGAGKLGGSAIWDVTGASIYNSGRLQGGLGGDGGAGSGVGGIGGAGGEGGFGAVFVGGGLINYSVITGGQGGQGGGPLGAGGLGGAGVILVAGVVANHGTIIGAQGGAGGSGGEYGGVGGVGGAGVVLDAEAGTLNNTGVIIAGAGGVGGYGSVRSGAAGAAGSGVIGYRYGLFSVVNGAMGSTGATIMGNIGVYGPPVGAKATSLTVTNFGTIVGTSGVSVEFLNAYDTLIAEAGSTFVGVVKAKGGELDLEGAGAGTLTGLGATGVVSGPESFTFSGFGRYLLGPGSTWTLAGTNSLAAAGWINVEGTVINTGSLYGGAYGAFPRGSGQTPIDLGGGLLTNRLIIRGGAGVAGATAAGGNGAGGVFLRGGAVVNAAGARIYGGQGGAAASGSGALGGSGGAGVLMLSGGTLSNYGRIQGGSGGAGGGAGGEGVFAGYLGSIVNFGTIEGGAGAHTNRSSDDLGVFLVGNASVINGSSTRHGALIDGYVGLYGSGSGASTIINFGTIKGGGGTSVVLQSASDWLAAEAGSSLIGAADGGGGTLELAPASGTISGLGVTGIVSGAIAMTFSGFGSYQIDSGGAWTLKGANRLGAAQKLALLGSVVLNGALDNSGALTITGALIGTGTLTNVGGATTIDNHATIGVAAWVTSGGTTNIDQSLTFAGAFRESATGAVVLGAGDGLTLIGSTALYGLAAGPAQGGATLVVGNATISGLVIGGTLAFASSGTVTQSGLVTIGDATSSSASLSILKGGVWNIGTGGIGRGASITNKLFNYGELIKNTGTTVSIISIGMTNNGLVEVASGVLNLRQLVIGTGQLKIDAGATLEAAATSSTISAIFNGANATLGLALPRNFAATLSGFTATDTIDLIRIKATGASINASDQLVIVNGAKTVASLQLSGAYSGATLNVASDGKGGTDITLLTAAATVHPMIAAMAALGASGAGLAGSHEPAPVAPPTLVRPGS